MREHKTNERISRREFLKVAGLGAAASIVLTGCDSAARHVLPPSYRAVSENMLDGQGAYFAATCGECSAGCGLLVSNFEGREETLRGNPRHPVSHGSLCARGQAVLQGAGSADRNREPLKQSGRGSGIFQALEWDAALKVVQGALQKYAAGEIVFLLGLFPDHLNDLVQLLSRALGGAQVLRYAPSGEFDGRVTLMDASQKLFGASKLPFFDLEHAEAAFSFGANFSETWLSPAAYSSACDRMRQGASGQRGRLIHFEPRCSQTAGDADEWVPIHPGSEGLLAQALGSIIQSSYAAPGAHIFPQIDLKQAAAATGVAVDEMRRLAHIYYTASRQVAIPGGVPLGYANGLQAAEAILGLNVLVDNLGRDGGLFLTPEAPLYPELASRPSTTAEMAGLIHRMQSGRVKALFIHDANPLYGLPPALGFGEALKNVELLISFAAYPDETSRQADYIFPDHTALESWGYQKTLAGANCMAVSSLQPVIPPLYNTRSTVDILLAAVQAVGGGLAQRLPYHHEMEFLQQSVAVLHDQGGPYTAPNATEFWPLWLQHGGWWLEGAGLLPPVSILKAGQRLTPLEVESAIPQDEFFLLPFPHPGLEAGSRAALPALQDVSGQNSWVEINRHTALELGVQDGDIVRLTSPYGEVEVSARLSPSIHPRLAAAPVELGRAFFGRDAAGCDANILQVLGAAQNASGSLAFAATRVKITPTFGHAERSEASECSDGDPSLRSG